MLFLISVHHFSLIRRAVLALSEALISVLPVFPPKEDTGHG